MTDEGPTSDEVAASFREAMRRHAAGVCVISVGAGEQVNGMAATAVASFSMAPAAMLVCVNEQASIAQALSEGVAFGLTLLGRQHESVAVAFSRKPSGRGRFSHPDWRLDPEAPPWLIDSPANLACVVVRTLTYGTHRAVIGRVTSVRLGPPSASLVFHDGTYQ